MTVVVYNCFHWVGFHYVNYLLEKGMVVKGVDRIDNEKKENLSMLVGRNSSFELLDELQEGDATKGIVIGDVALSSFPNLDQVIQINLNGIQTRIPKATVIDAPILFGEWMDMKSNGITLGNRFISFDSVEFQTDAVYIEDFIKATYPLIQRKTKSRKILVFSKKVLLNESVKLENSIYIRDNIPKDKSVKKVIAHYERFKYYYK